MKYNFTKAKDYAKPFTRMDLSELIGRGGLREFMGRELKHLLRIALLTIFVLHRNLIIVTVHYIKYMQFV